MQMHFFFLVSDLVVSIPKPLEKLDVSLTVHHH